MPRSAVDTDERYNEQPFDRWHAWQDLIARAESRTDATLKRGSFITSIHELAKDWGWSYLRVWRDLQRMHGERLTLFELPGERTREGSRLLITIDKYERYQSPRNYATSTERTVKELVKEPDRAKPRPDKDLHAHATPGERPRERTVKELDSQVVAQRALTSPQEVRSKKEELSIISICEDTDTGRPPTARAEPAPDDEEPPQDPEDAMTDELPDTIDTDGPALIKAAAAVVVAFQRAWPATSRLRFRPPSPAEFEAVKVAILNEAGNWKGVRDGHAQIAADCQTRNFEPQTIAYATRTWNSRGAQREAERAIAEANAELDDPDLRAIVGLVADSTELPAPPPAPEPPKPKSYIPNRDAEAKAWQERYRAEREAEKREPKHEPTPEEAERIRAQINETLNRIGTKHAH